MQTLSSKLVAAMDRRGHWRGELASSALSTATAVCALELYRGGGGESAGPAALHHPPERLANAARAGADWLCRTQNPDGGWGDTVDSPSNVSTTTLCWAVLGLLDATRDAGAPPRRGGDEHDPLGGAEPAARAEAPGRAEALQRARSWLHRDIGELSPASLAAAITRAYGDDRTFSAPILTMCALAGRLGESADAWAHVPALPFELAALPRRTFHLLGLPTVSYALPALIAIGQAHHHHRPSHNPLARMVRGLARRPTLRKLRAIQPEDGGFLEATPLTAFVTMSLVSIGEADHEVTQRGVAFLLDSMRGDGSWPIDTDLATWVTTLAIGALAAGGRLDSHLGENDLRRVGRWLLDQQVRGVHPYTGARPGGWAWTDLPGGVPDADDTAGVLLALHHLDEAGAVDHDETVDAADRGVGWLLELQNRDGGIPTFCRGWGKLPFDRSGADLTAHALRAWSAWEADMPPATRARLRRARRRAVQFLIEAQRPDGAWVPLWFGNQLEARQENPVYGTARVLLASGVDLGSDETPIRGPGAYGPAGATPPVQRRRATETGHRWQEALGRGRRWLLAAQNADGGWGGGPPLPSTIEETALAVAALAANATARRSTLPALAGDEPAGPPPVGGAGLDPDAQQPMARALAWLEQRTAGASPLRAAPIGLYFAKLWYSEKLYPLIFATAAAEATGAAKASSSGPVTETTSNETEAEATSPGHGEAAADRTAAGRRDVPRGELSR